MEDIEAGDEIVLTSPKYETHQGGFWKGRILTVDEVKPWGVKAHVETAGGQAHTRVPFSDFRKLAVSVPEDAEDCTGDWWAVVEDGSKRFVFWSSYPWDMPPQDLLDESLDWCRKACRVVGGVSFSGEVKAVVDDGGEVLVRLAGGWHIFDRKLEVKPLHAARKVPDNV